MAKINFGGTVEDVVTSEEFTVKKAQDVLKNEVIAVLGYGVQGPAQAFNMKDNGVSVIIGQTKEDKVYWDKAIADYTKSIRIDPTDALSYCDRGRVYQLAKLAPNACGSVNRFVFRTNVMTVRFKVPRG